MHWTPSRLNVCLWHGVWGEGYIDWSTTAFSIKLILNVAVALVAYKRCVTSTET